MNSSPEYVIPTVLALDEGLAGLIPFTRAMQKTTPKAPIPPAASGNTNGAPCSSAKYAIPKAVPLQTVMKQPITTFPMTELPDFCSDIGFSISRSGLRT